MTHLQCLELEFVLTSQVQLIGSRVTAVLLLCYCCVTQTVLNAITREIPWEGADLCNLYSKCVKFRRRLLTRLFECNGFLFCATGMQLVSYLLLVHRTSNYFMQHNSQ